MAYQLISKDRLFAEYYRRTKGEGMPSPKAQVAVMRSSRSPAFDRSVEDDRVPFSRPASSPASAGRQVEL
jgi:hypothetical protein